MIKIKNAIARTIKNLGKLCAFALLILPAFAICCLLGSWTIDNQGNLIGENLLNVYEKKVISNGNNYRFEYIRYDIASDRPYTLTYKKKWKWSKLCSCIQ